MTVSLDPPAELFRDARFVVLDKPAGLAVHAGPRGGPSVEDFFPALSRRRHGPWLAHRLDADTAGCLVVALTKSALLAAQAEFAAGRAEKIYWAVAHGAPAEESGTISASLRKVTGPGGWRMVVDAAGQDATSDWRVLGRGGGISLLEVRPRTGRTHQDGVYGAGEAGGLMLLAQSITLRVDPVLRAVAPVPARMRERLSKEALLF